LLKNLKEKSAEVFGLDPLYLGHEVEALGFKDWFIEPEPIDAIIVQNSDDYFKEFLKTESLDQVPIFDGRRLFLEKEDFNVVYQLGNPSI
jgi:hypothetical protein